MNTRGVPLKEMFVTESHPAFLDFTNPIALLQVGDIVMYVESPFL